jgi:hypothetical protein
MQTRARLPQNRHPDAQMSQSRVQVSSFLYSAFLVVCAFVKYLLLIHFGFIIFGIKKVLSAQFGGIDLDSIV